MVFDKEKYNLMISENNEILKKGEELQDEFMNYCNVAMSENPKASYDDIFKAWIYLKLAELSLGKKFNMI